MKGIEDLVTELSEKLSSSNPDMLECLKKARIVAQHFNDTNIVSWIDNELFGYKDAKETPEYRKISVVPYNTYIRQEPIGFGYIMRSREKEMLGIYPISFIWSITEIITHSKKEQVSLEIIQKDSGSPTRVLTNGSDFNKILLSINIQLQKYIQLKLESLKIIPEEFFLMRILNRFNAIVLQLQERHENRPTITISNEYDVQDLLRSLLMIGFDSVKKEEYSPSVAGKRPRLDFFLKYEKLAIEVKFIRDKTHAKKLGEEIAIDKEFYSHRPDLAYLYFFIYDPHSYLQERVEFVTDLMKYKPAQLATIKIVIKPEI